MKWIIVTLFSLSLVIASSLMAVETGKIVGRVVMKDTREPLPVANVEIENYPSGAATNLEGYYWIENLPSGTYNIKARYIGFKDGIEKNVKITSGETKEVNFALASGILREDKRVFVFKREIKYFSVDSVLVVGTLYPPSKKISQTVVLLHMLSRNRVDWEPFATKLWKKGYGILSIDLRGHGESVKMGDEVLDFRKFSKEMYQNMVLDVKAAVEFLKEEKRIDTENIVIMGASIGGNVALNYAATDERVKGVVLLSAGLDYRGVKTEEAMREYGERPVLIVTSEEDKYAYQSAKKLYEIAKGTKELKIYKNAGHGTRIFDKEEGLKDLILTWLDKVAGDEKPKDANTK